MKLRRGNDAVVNCWYALQPLICADDNVDIKTAAAAVAMARERRRGDILSGVFDVADDDEIIIGCFFCSLLGWK